MSSEYQAYPTQYFAAQSAAGSQFYAQSNPQSCTTGNGSQPLMQDYQTNSQQGFQSLSQPQWQPSPQMQQSSPLSMCSIVSPQYCAPLPTTFYVKDKLLSWSGGDVTILDAQGNVAFTVDSKVLSIRGSRVLKNAFGNPVCAMKEKVMHWQCNVTAPHECQGGMHVDSCLAAVQSPMLLAHSLT